MLILVHELGHFVFARLFDVKVLRFSLGFGPRIFGFTHRETEYRLSLVPLGGYVRLLGEDPGEPIPPIDRPRALAAKPLWQRYTIVIAGPLFNMLLPLLIYFVHYAGQRTLLPPTIGTVLPGLPAASAGLLPGDRVETVDGQAHPLLGGAGAGDRRLGRQDAAVRDPPRPRRRGARRDADAIRAARARCTSKEHVGWIGVSPRFHLPEIGVLDPTSPAAQAGLKTFDFVTAVNGVPVGDLDRVRQGDRPRGRLAAAAQLPARRLLGRPVRAHRAAGAGLGGRHSDGGVRRRRAPPLRDRHRLGRAVRLLGRAGQPRRSDWHPPRRRDPRRWTARRCRTGTCCASGWRPCPQRTFRIAWTLAGRRAARGELPAGGPLRAGRLPPGGAAPGVRRAQPAGLEDRAAGADHATASATRSPTRSSARGRSSSR